MFLLRKSSNPGLGLARLNYNPVRLLSVQAEPRSNEQDEGNWCFVGYPRVFIKSSFILIWTEFRVLNLRQVRNQRQMRKRFVRPELPPPR